jgi:hypothetical protein
VSERYVVLGLARPRARWFGEISRWATSAALPLEFVKCLTIDETRARLTSGRAWSSLLVDANVPGIDRDLIDLANGAGAAVLVIDDPRVPRSWQELGARAVLPAALERDDLLAALAEHARPVSRSAPRIDEPPSSHPPPWRGRLVAVTGAGGTGASTLAAMLAQGFAGDVTQQGLVLLADLALDADQAVIHDAGDVMPGLPELVDAHRLGLPEPDEIRSLTFHCPYRGYHLLLGLRRHRDWSSLRPKALDAALDGLRRSYRVVIADIDSDLEGEDQTGSLEVEDRNLLARRSVAEADAVVAVGAPGVVGIHQLARLLRDLVAHGVPPSRILPVLNRGPSSRRRRSELSHAVAAMAGPGAVELASAVVIPERKGVDSLIRTGGRWPDATARQLHRMVEAILDRPTDERIDPSGHVPVVPGSLGHYSDLEVGER